MTTHDFPALRAYDLALRSQFSGPALRELSEDERSALGDIHFGAIVFANRSGSTFLSDSLYRRGLPFPPQVEVLNADLVGRVCREEGKSSFTDYFLSTVLGWARYGLCGFKVGAQQLQWLQEAGLLGVFASTRVLRVRRRDRIAQAVSLFIARSTGSWHATMKIDRQPDEFDYDADAISQALQDIVTMEQDIDRVLRDRNLATLDVYYEDLVDSTGQVLARCADFLGWVRAVDPGFYPQVEPLTSQHTPRNTRFVERFRRERG